MTARLLFAPQRGSSRKSAAYRKMHARILEKIGTRRRDLEFLFGKAAFAFLERVLPRDCVVMHVPNGGPDKVWRSRCAALGMKNGAPDIFVHSALRTVAFETKAPKGRLSKDQREMHAKLERIGIHVATVRRLEEIEGHLRAWGFQLRGGVV